MSRQLHIGLAGIAFDPFYAFSTEVFRERSFLFAKEVNRLTCACTLVEDPIFTAEDALKAASTLNSSGCDLIVFDICTYPEGKAYMTFLDNIEQPVLLWSRPEERKTGPVGHNSFCGANFVGACLSGRGRKYRHLFGELSSPEFSSRLRSAIRILQAAKKAGGSKIGLVGGGIVPKFHDIDIAREDRKRLKEVWDIEFLDIPTDEIMGQVRNLQADTVRAEAEREDACYSEKTVPEQALLEQAGLVLSLRNTARELEIDALAIRCWPELQNGWSIWPCGAIGHLCDLGIPTACEGDPGGALDMLIASHLSEKPSTLLDIIDFDDSNDSVSVWHCGPSAPSLAGGPVSLAHHAVDGRNEEGSPAKGFPSIHDLDLKKGSVTLLRTLGALDDEFLITGEMLERNGEHITGSFGRVTSLSEYGSPISVREMRERIISRGIPHHYTVFYRTSNE